MRKGDYEIVFKTHAVFRAEERRIPWDLIESTVQTGEFEKFGKRMVKISKEFKDARITCVGEIVGDVLKIITITSSRKW